VTEKAAVPAMAGRAYRVRQGQLEAGCEHTADALAIPKEDAIGCELSRRNSGETGNAEIDSGGKPLAFGSCWRHGCGTGDAV